jgi:D-alanyl-D-alanine dipeptidase
MEDYQSMKDHGAQQGEDPSAPTEHSVIIESPVVNLDAMPKREQHDFVKVRDYIPDLIVDLKYATSTNFTGQVVYDLRRSICATAPS